MDLWERVPKDQAGARNVVIAIISAIPKNINEKNRKKFLIMQEQSFKVLDEASEISDQCWVVDVLSLKETPPSIRCGIPAVFVKDLSLGHDGERFSRGSCILYNGLDDCLNGVRAYKSGESCGVALSDPSWSRPYVDDDVQGGGVKSERKVYIGDDRPSDAEVMDCCKEMGLTKSVLRIPSPFQPRDVPTADVVVCNPHVMGTAHVEEHGSMTQGFETMVGTEAWEAMASGDQSEFLFSAHKERAAGRFVHASIFDLKVEGRTYHPFSVRKAAK